MAATTTRRRCREHWGIAGLVVGLTGLLWGAQLASVCAMEVLAVLTQAEGRITVSDGAGIPWRARPIEVLRTGAVVRVEPEGNQAAWAGLVCSTEHWIRLEGTTSWVVTAEACRQGRPLPTGTYHDVLPQAGRLYMLDGLLVVRSGTRAEEPTDPVDIPVVLSPRYTALLDARPTIRWTPVPEAKTYEIVFTGQPSFIHRLDAAQVACGLEMLGGSTMVVCSTPFPAGQPGLMPGELAFLRVGARLGLTSPLRHTPGSHPMRLLTTEQRTAVITQRARLAALPVEEATRHLLLAQLYAAHGLLADALAAYYTALQQQESAEVYVMLGDLYLTTQLYALAHQSYHAAMRLSQSPAIQAATAFGLGRVQYATARFGQAVASFQQAADLYTRLGVGDEAEAAQRAAAEALQRQSR